MKNKFSAPPSVMKKYLARPFVSRNRLPAGCCWFATTELARSCIGVAAATISSTASGAKPVRNRDCRCIRSASCGESFLGIMFCVATMSSAAGGTRGQEWPYRPGFPAYSLSGFCGYCSDLDCAVGREFHVEGEIDPPLGHYARTHGTKRGIANVYLGQVLRRACSRQLSAAARAACPFFFQRAYFRMVRDSNAVPQFSGDFPRALLLLPVTQPGEWG
jgi:hypothetical protein